MLILLLTAMSAAIFFPAGKTAAKEQKLSADEQSLCRFMLELETSAVSPKLLRVVEKISKRSKDDKLQARALGLVALYEAGTKKEISKNLATIAPYILPADLAGKYQKSVEKSSKQVPEFPSASKWDLKQPELCVTAAKILTLDKKYVEALAGFNRVGEKVDNLPRVMASEGMGDMLFSLRRYEQCVSSYEFALSVLSWLKQQSEYLNDPDKTILILEKIIRKKLARAMDAWDAERYGPGFVAYRNARRVEFSKDYLTASVLYRELKKDFPETVYSEAASLYRNKCLLKISEDIKGEQADKKLQQLSDTISFQEKLLKKYKKRMAPRIYDMYKKELEQDSRLLRKLKEVPYGKKAADLAISQLGSFIKANPSGLYRGEALQMLGDHFLENKLNLEQAFSYYSECYKWLGTIKKQKAALDQWQVPDKAAYPTSPPATEKKLSGWIQAITENPIKPEQIINRLHCHWYLDSLKARNGKMLSLCFFMKGDYDQALKAARAVVLYEPLEKMFYNSGQRNSYSRLVKYYKRKWMYAEPEEIKCFSDKLKTALILGDFYYAVEAEQRCREIRENLVAGKYGKLTKKQHAVARYYLAEIIFRQGDFKAAVEVIKPFAEGKLKGTNCSAKALIGLGNIYYQKNDNKSIDLATRCYAKAELYAQGNTKETAMFFLANAYKRQKLDKHADAKYKQILKLNPDTVWKSLITKYYKK